MLSSFVELLLRHFEMMRWVPVPDLSLPQPISAFSLHCREQFYMTSDFLTRTASQLLYMFVL